MTTLFANGQTDDLGGGLFRTTLGLKPVNYLSGNTYLPIVNNWVDGDQDSPHIVNTAALRVRADGVGRRNLYPIPGNDAVYISVGRPWYQPSTWQVAPMNALTRANNRLQSINANYNLYLDHAGHFAKLGILLKGGFVPPNGRFAFPVSLVGLTRQGNTLYHNGQPVMVLRRPVVYDFANPDDVREITFNFGAFGSQTGVIFNLPDLTGMQQPLVDPTLTLQPDATAGVDNSISSSAPTSNNGTGANPLIGENNSASSIGRLLIKFDLSSLPDAAILSSTILSLYATNDLSSNARTFRVFRQKRAWTELGSTWNKYDGVSDWQTAGGFGANDCEQADIGSRAFTATETLNEFKDFPLTPTTKAGLDLGNGWLIKPDTEIDDGYTVASSDHATAANRPKLVIEYTTGIPKHAMYYQRMRQT